MSVYDPEKEETKTPRTGSHDGLGDLDPHETASSIDQMEAGLADSRESTAEQSEQGALDGLGDGTERTESFYKGGKTPVRLSSARSLLKSKKFALLGGVFMFVGAIVIIIMIILGFLKIPHLAENIASWQFARTSRIFRLSLSEIDGQKTALDVADNSTYSALRGRYEGLRGRTWGKFDQYRPNRVFQNLKTDNIISYEYTEPDRLLQRRRLAAVVIDGERIPVNNNANSRWRQLIHPVQSRNDRIRFGAQLDANLDEAIRGNKSLIRSAVAKRLRDEIGLKLRWWEQKGKTYQGLRADEADRQLVRKAVAEIADTNRESSSLKPLSEAEAQLDDNMKTCLSNPSCADEVARTGEIPDRFLAQLDDSLKPSLGARALSTASTALAIGIPACIIYEGSLIKSGPTIDKQSEELRKTYGSIATAYDQQKKGETTTEAVGAMNRKIGSAANSIPHRRSTNDPANPTNVVPSPHATPTGDYTIFNSLLGGGFASALDFVAGRACPLLTDWRFGLGVAAGELIAAFFSGGGTAAGSTATRVAVREYVESVARSFFTKKTAKRVVGEGGATVGATAVAKLIVVSRVGTQTSGISQGEEYAAQADMGGNLEANEQNRQMFYGRPMTGEEVAMDNSENRRHIAMQESKKPAFERYLALTNPNSLLTKSSTSVAGALNGNGAIASLPQKMISYISSSLANVFYSFNPSGSNVFAQTTGEEHYNIIQWGFSQDEMTTVEQNPSYSVLENSRILEESGRVDDIEEEDYEDCFTESMGTLIAESKIRRGSDGRVIADQGQCSPNNLGMNNSEYGDLVFRWRLDHMYQNTFDHLDGIQNPEENDPVAASGGAQPDGVVGMDQIGPIPGIDPGCHTSIVAQVTEMVEAAASAGVSLTGSCWRDPQRQIELRRAHCGSSHYAIYEAPSSSCSPPTAIPGTSMHERGLAIDFENCSSHSTSCWQWLNGNAGRYGLQNLPSEPWHWSTTGG